MGLLDHWHGMRFEEDAFMKSMICTRLPKKRREHYNAAQNGD